VISVEVNRDRCEGHGLCEQAAPLVYRLDDDGHVELVASEITAALLPGAEAGARLCPVNALKVLGAHAE
jgi:ferredoxin